jgi:hypothetical protein
MNSTGQGNMSATVMMVVMMIIRGIMTIDFGPDMKTASHSACQVGYKTSLGKGYKGDVLHL